MPRLISRNRPVLSVADVVRLAQDEFGFVNVDSKRGLRFIAERLISKTASPLETKWADRQLAPLADSVEMIVGDDCKSDDRFLKCYVIPGEPVHIEYVFEGHDRLCEDLLHRLKKTLDYEYEP